MPSYHTNLNITPAGAYEQVVTAIQARAARDPEVVCVDRAHLGQWLVFLRGAESLEEDRQRFLAGYAPYPSDAILRILTQREGGAVRKFWLELSQECEPTARQHMVEYVKWILKEFAPCRVHDTDTGENLSAVAAQDPDEIFPFDDLRPSTTL